ncbi:thioesterase [Solihabitans fulvus]|uniref:Thioesterase n=1 Tax=Solihabitans fulvus TaxID=1892852 RepID=A0A5B2WUA6_9PSEU|nr:thioesterase family protein [Solihabitans fulvus]KAA2254454.1 thioesterase [Solihabitans fulvus]
MTATILSPPTPSALVDGGPTTMLGRPRYEGANIRTWIGFKHFMYLVEEAVLAYFRERGVGARDLFQRHGLGLEIVDSSVQLPTALEVDDVVRVTIAAGRQKPGCGAAFTAHIAVDRDGVDVTALKGRLRVALIREQDAADVEPVPDFLAPYVFPGVAALADAADAAGVELAPGQDVADALTPAGSGAFLWSWRIPYFYCHFSDRLQHSGYVRAMEEVVDRFLHSRGLAIGVLLAERGWIPVVSRARVRLLADAHMEETVHTVFAVEDILRDISYTARMDCYVRRGDRLVHTATGTIMHGYAISRGERAGTVAELDATTQAVLLGGAR